MRDARPAPFSPAYLLGALRRGRFSVATPAAGVVLALACLALATRPDLRGPNTLFFLAQFAPAAAAYIAAVLSMARERPSLGMIWGFALIFRGVLPLALPTLSDDVYRYIWDGHLLLEGINPYAHPVNAAALDAFATPLRSAVGHNWMASPYLPAAQVLFALVEAVAPQNPAAFQFVALLLDLATGWLVMDLLGRLGLDRRLALLYLWNPLVVIEFAHGAHVDAWMLFLTMLAFWCAARAGRRPGWLAASALLLAAATLTKGLPLLLAPLFLRLWGRRGAAIYALAVLGACAVFAVSAGWGLSGPLDGRGVFGALRIFLDQWNFNGGLYRRLEIALTGYTGTGAAPMLPEFLASIRLARAITGGLTLLAALVAGALAWRGPTIGRQAGLSRLRLAMLPLGAYLLLAATLHPWYVTIILPFLPFVWPARRSLVWPWLALSCLAPLSYLTYLHPGRLGEAAWVEAVEYIPVYVLLALGLLPVLWARRPALPRIWFWAAPRKAEILVSDNSDNYAP